MKKLWSTGLLSLLLLLLAGCGTAPDADKTPAPASVTSPAAAQAMYNDAVRNATFADEDEVLPLVTLTREDDRVTWDTQGRVLLLTWHKYPESYPEGEQVILSHGPVWTFTDREIAAAYDAQADQVSDWTLRLEQLIGLPPDCGYTTVTGLWVELQNIRRPAYQTDPTKDAMETSFGENIDASFKAWFDQNILDSYFYGAYPWTRLGYTYDWSSHEQAYGMTEFLVSQDAKVQVAFTLPTDEFLSALDSGALATPAA